MSSVMLVRLVVLTQEILPVVVAVRGSNDAMDVNPSWHLWARQRDRRLMVELDQDDRTVNSIVENRIVSGAALGRRFGLEIHAGHGLHYATAERIAELGEVVELNIGHFLIGEAVSVGLDQAIRTMRAAMDRGRARAQR